MSARVESAPVGRFNVGAMAIAVAIALGIGGVAGLMVTRATEDRPAAITTPVGIPSWDVQKLEAKKGRQLAEEVRSQPGTADRWDEGKLEAMEGRQLAEEIRRRRPPGGPLGERHPEGRARYAGAPPSAYVDAWPRLGISPDPRARTLPKAFTAASHLGAKLGGDGRGGFGRRHEMRRGW